MTFFFTETYIEKGRKRSKTGHKYHLFMSFARSDYISKISLPKATKSRSVGLFTTNDGPKARQCFFGAISSPSATKSRMVGPFTMNKGTKARVYRFRRRRRRSTCLRPVYRCRRCKYFVEEGDKITGRRPVNYERRAAGPSVQISSRKAKMNGPKARVPASMMPIFCRRRRPNHGP